MKMYAPYYFVFYLNSQFWKVLLRLHLFLDDKICRRIENTSDVKISKICRIFFNKTLRNKVFSVWNLVFHSYLFSNFYTRCVYLLSGTCSVKVKIELDIILSEITFNYSLVKRRVAYFLKLYKGERPIFKI